MTSRFPNLQALGSRTDPPTDSDPPDHLAHLPRAQRSDRVPLETLPRPKDRRSATLHRRLGIDRTRREMLADRPYLGELLIIAIVFVIRTELTHFSTSHPSRPPRSGPCPSRPPTTSCVCPPPPLPSPSSPSPLTALSNLLPPTCCAASPFLPEPGPSPSHGHRQNPSRSTGNGNGPIRTLSLETRTARSGNGSCHNRPNLAAWASESRSRAEPWWRKSRRTDGEQRRRTGVKRAQSSGVSPSCRESAV
jgi:hypothetical protein